MEPNIWGKHAWIFLHSVSMNYPNNPNHEEKLIFKNFFLSLKGILPCEVCKKHYSKHIQVNPIEPALQSKRKLVEWLINLHNQVNISLNKPTMTYDEVIELYKKIYNNNLFSEKYQIKFNSEPKTNNINHTDFNNGNSFINNLHLENNIIIIIIITITIFIFLLWKNI